jgi:biofilm PGA synthesis N-glycosyltransferase PgaC
MMFETAQRTAAPGATTDTTARRLLLISPVRNEAEHFERVAAAVAQQTRPPDLWIVVDDGSTDETPEILSRLAQQIEFMRVVNVHPQDRALAGAVKDRLASAAEVKAFNLGLRSVDWRSYSHIAKLDGDTELPREYFERLLDRFTGDERLGLAGGVYADPDPGANGWSVVEIPLDYHVPGTLKCYTRACLQAIGGLQERLAWDTIDETYARMHGYRTRAFPDLVARHHRPWGSADGTIRGRARHGRCAYIAHFPLLWATLRAFKVARARPRVLSGGAFLYGYLRAAAKREARVEDRELRRFVRRELRARMLRAARLPYSPARRSVSSQTLPDHVVTALSK